MAWHDSGAYLSAVGRAQRAATAVIREGTRFPRPALVLDIDETSLSNWPYLQARQFAITEESFAVWVSRHNDVPLTPTLELFRAARTAGVSVFFVSGRRESLRADTERQLLAAGYHGWTRLILRPENDRQASVIPFKSGARRGLEAEGYTIVLNMGDQESDLAGGHARRRIKLPNPFYFLP